MLAKTESVALIGTEAFLVEVEVDVGTGVPRFAIVGLPSSTVRESEQRVRSAIISSSESWPQQRITANLAPGALRKEGTHFDLPMALGVLAASRRVPGEPLAGWIVVGELALDGSIRPVRGTLAAAITCREAGRKGIVCPAANAGEAALVEGIEVVPVTSLRDCIDWSKGRWQPPAIALSSAPLPSSDNDMSEVRGQDDAKAAIEVAAAGGHNLLLEGPPGSGKTMLASRFPGVLPSMSSTESMEATRVHSVAGLLGENAGLLTQRPFRSPHHHISLAGMVGGGTGLPRPGEVSLAHHGVLFVDELPLFRGDVLESLRTPLESGVVRLARAGGSFTFPSRFVLVAAMNPCPCGYSDDTRAGCRCSNRQRLAYDAKLSGPLIDRFDLQVKVRRLGKRELLEASHGESTADIKSRVDLARLVQADRYGGNLTNGSVPAGRLRLSLELSSSARAYLGEAIDHLRLTARGFDRLLRVARTLADLSGDSSIGEDHVLNAMTFRLERSWVGEVA